MDELEPGHGQVTDIGNEGHDHEDNRPSELVEPGTPSQSDAPDTTIELDCELNEAGESIKSNESDEADESNKPDPEQNTPDNVDDLHGESQQPDDFGGELEANNPNEAEDKQEPANPNEREIISLEFNSSLVHFTNMFPHLDIKLIDQVVRSQKGGVDAIIDELLAISSQIDPGAGIEDDASRVIDEQNILLNMHNKDAATPDLQTILNFAENLAITSTLSPGASTQSDDQPSTSGYSNEQTPPHCSPVPMTSFAAQYTFGNSPLRKIFLDIYSQFFEHDYVGSPCDDIPLVDIVRNVPFDLYPMYREVCIRGGFNEVDKSKDSWDEVILDALKFQPQDSDKSSVRASIRGMYKFYLYRFEKEHKHSFDFIFLGGNYAAVGDKVGDKVQGMDIITEAGETDTITDQNAKRSTKTGDDGNESGNYGDMKNFKKYEELQEIMYRNYVRNQSTKSIFIVDDDENPGGSTNMSDAHSNITLEQQGSGSSMVDDPTTIQPDDNQNVGVADSNNETQSINTVKVTNYGQSSKTKRNVSTVQDAAITSSNIVEPQIEDHRSKKKQKRTSNIAAESSGAIATGGSYTNSNDIHGFSQLGSNIIHGKGTDPSTSYYGGAFSSTVVPQFADRMGLGASAANPQPPAFPASLPSIPYLPSLPSSSSLSSLPSGSSPSLLSLYPSYRKEKLLLKISDMSPEMSVQKVKKYLSEVVNKAPDERTRRNAKDLIVQVTAGTIDEATFLYQLEQVFGRTPSPRSLCLLEFFQKSIPLLRSGGGSSFIRSTVKPRIKITTLPLNVANSNTSNTSAAQLAAQLAASLHASTSNTSAMQLGASAATLHASTSNTSAMRMMVHARRERGLIVRAAAAAGSGAVLKSSAGNLTYRPAAQAAIIAAQAATSLQQRRRSSTGLSRTTTCTPAGVDDELIKAAKAHAQEQLQICKEEKKAATLDFSLITVENTSTEFTSVTETCKMFFNLYANCTVELKEVMRVVCHSNRVGFWEKALETSTPSVQVELYKLVPMLVWNITSVSEVYDNILRDRGRSTSRFYSFYKHALPSESGGRFTMVIADVLMGLDIDLSDETSVGTPTPHHVCYRNQIQLKYIVHLATKKCHYNNPRDVLAGQTDGIKHFDLAAFDWRDISNPYCDLLMKAKALYSMRPKFPPFSKYHQYVLHEPTRIGVVVCKRAGEKYDEKLAELSENGGKEIYAFHGTAPENAQSIATRNLDPARTPVHGRAHGHGCYFSEYPQFSARYGHTCMFIFKLQLIPNQYKMHKADDQGYCEIIVIKDSSLFKPEYVLYFDNSAVF